MPQITVRNIPASVEAKLRSLAERSGQSLNQTVIQLLEKATGGKPEARRRDLSAIAARWDESEAEAFDRATAAFESVDELLLTGHHARCGVYRAHSHQRYLDRSGRT